MAKDSAIEPEEANIRKTPEDTLISMAISLKRIADAMCETNEYGESGAAAIHGAIRRGLQNAR